MACRCTLDWLAGSGIGSGPPESNVAAVGWTDAVEDVGGGNVADGSAIAGIE